MTDPPPEQAGAEPAAERANASSARSAIRPADAALIVGAALLLAAAAVAVYAPAWRGTLVFDSFVRLEAIESANQLMPLSSYLLGEAGRRGMTHLSFAINHAMGLNTPALLRMTNLAIHLASAAALASLLVRTLPRTPLAAASPAVRSGMVIAVVTLWLLHPMHVGAVSYVIQRGEALAGLAMLAALWTYAGAAEARGWPAYAGWGAGAILASIIGMLSKETFYVTPLILLAFDWTLLRKAASPFWSRRLPLLVAVAATLVLPIHAGFDDVAAPASPPPGPVAAEPTTGTEPLAAGAPRDGDDAAPPLRLDRHSGLHVDRVPTAHYFFTQPVVFGHYLLRLAWPRHLAIDYGWPAFGTIWPDAPDAWLIPLAFALAVAGGVVSLWGLVRRRWWGLLGVWWFLTLAPSSSFISLQDMAFDHRVYLASLAPLLLIAGGLASRLPATTRGRGAALACVIVAAAGLGTATWLRNATFASRETLWARVVQVRPDHARGHVNLAAARFDAGDSEAAAAHLRRAVQLEPASFSAQLQLVACLLAMGDNDAAGRHLQTLRLRRPDHATVNLHLGEWHRRRNELADAEAALRRAVDVRRPSAESLTKLADVISRRGGDRAEVLDLLRRAAVADPDDLTPRIVLGSMLLAAGRADEAVEHLAVAARLDADNPRRWLRLGRAQLQRGEPHAAVAALAEATRLAPQRPEPWVALAEAQLQAGAPRRAREALASAALATGAGPEARRELRMRRAWVLAVAEELRLRDGDEAMRAVRELRHEWGEQSPRWLELAAAVHAEQGDFPQAVTLQLLALRRQGVEPEKLAPQDPRRLRLNAYRDNQPWREPGLPFAPSQGGP